MQRFRCFRVVGSEVVLSDEERALVEGLGFRKPALLAIEVSQSAQGVGHQRMRAPQRALAIRERALVEGLRLGILTLLIRETRQSAQGVGDIGMRVGA
jgi:hypothetical protein